MRGHPPLGMFPGGELASLAIQQRERGAALPSEPRKIMRDCTTELLHLYNTDVGILIQYWRRRNCTFSVSCRVQLQCSSALPPLGFHRNYLEHRFEETESRFRENEPWGRWMQFYIWSKQQAEEHRRRLTSLTPQPTGAQRSILSCLRRCSPAYRQWLLTTPTLSSNVTEVGSLPPPLTAAHP